MLSINDIKKYEKDIIGYRRDFHMNPETGFEEVKTSAKVIEVLEELGLQIVKDIATTGVIGILKGAEKGKTIALRADMDALNIQEENDVEYRSQVDGKMHACGHDSHTAMLLGAAKVLVEHKDKIKGTVNFIFQPAEEGPTPGGGIHIVESGALDDVDAAFAIHVSSLENTGHVQIHRKEAMAASDFFEVELIGVGTHGSAPHTGIDSVIMAGQLISAYQSIISRETDPTDPAVLSICTIHGGTVPNAITERIKITGTVRTVNEETRKKIFKRMEEVAKGITDMYHAKYKFQQIKTYPALINNEEMVDFAMNICKEIVCKEDVKKLDKPIMGAEDFAYYLQKVPGAIIWLGCGNEEKGITAPHHNPRFDIDEDSLIIGTAIHSNIVLKYLNK